MDILLSGTGYEFISAVAYYFCLIVIWMDSLSHNFHLIHIICGFQPHENTVLIDSLISIT